MIKMRKTTQWTNQEDSILMSLLSEAKCFQKWKFISQELQQKGFCKNETQCRDRFVNKLNPDLRKDKLGTEELRSLFKYYDQYGPMWSVFESLIPGRNQNLLKNKFYSALRSGIRLICFSAFRISEKQQSFSFASISSKLLVDIYEGKKNFKKYRPLIRKCFKKLDFQHDQDQAGLIEEIFGQENLIKISEEITSTLEGKAVKSRKQKAFSKSKQTFEIHEDDVGQNKKTKESKEDGINELVEPKLENTLAEVSQEENKLKWVGQMHWVQNGGQILYYYPWWNFFPNQFSTLQY